MPRLWWMLYAIGPIGNDFDDMGDRLDGYVRDLVCCCVLAMVENSFVVSNSRKVASIMMICSIPVRCWRCSSPPLCRNDRLLLLCWLILLHHLVMWPRGCCSKECIGCRTSRRRCRTSRRRCPSGVETIVLNLQ